MFFSKPELVTRVVPQSNGVEIIETVWRVVCEVCNATFMSPPMTDIDDRSLKSFWDDGSSMYVNTQPTGGALRALDPQEMVDLSAQRVALLDLQRRREHLGFWLERLEIDYWTHQNHKETTE